MTLEFLATSLALTLIIALRYLAVAGAAWWLFWRKGERGSRPSLNRRAPDRATIRREIAASLAASPIYAVPAAAALVGWRHGYTRLYLDPAAHGLLWLPLSALIYILAHDAYYYWLHRLLHHRALFAWAHRRHHLSRDPTPFASFAFDPAEALATAWFLPALSLIVPLQVGVALALLTLMTLAAVLNHAGVEVWPGAWLEHPFGRLFITATHHDLHHKRFSANYGLYFRFWDRLLGTDRVEG